MEQWPPELRLWVERSFGACKNDAERGRCEKDLKERISAANGTGRRAMPHDAPWRECMRGRGRMRWGMRGVWEGVHAMGQARDAHAPPPIPPHKPHLHPYSHVTPP